MSFFGSNSERIFITLSKSSVRCLTADVDGAIVTVLGIETEKLQPRLPSPNARVQEDCGDVKLTLQLTLNGAYSQVRVQCFEISHHDYTVPLSFQGGQECLEPTL